MKKQIRQIKLQPRHRALSWNKSKVVPSLTLSGGWLEEIGFKTGTKVTILIEENLLIIKPTE